MPGRKRPFKFKKQPFRSPAPTNEDKIKNFVVRNSKNGFFTRIQTIATKFEIPVDEVWSLLGSPLAENAIECVHDYKGEAKLCEAGQSAGIIQKEKQRRSQRNAESKQEGNGHDNR